MDPKHAEAHTRKGVCCHEMNLLDEAVKHYKIGIELDPNRVDNWMNMGHCYIRLNRLDDCLECYDKYLAYNPDNGQVLCNKSYALTTMKRFSEAKPILLKIIKDFPTYENYFNLATCHRMFYDLEEAEECLKKAIEAFPERP